MADLIKIANAAPYQDVEDLFWNDKTKEIWTPNYWSGDEWVQIPINKIPHEIEWSQYKCTPEGEKIVKQYGLKEGYTSLVNIFTKKMMGNNMKPINKLRQIIREEVQSTLTEEEWDESLTEESYEKLVKRFHARVLVTMQALKKKWKPQFDRYDNSPYVEPVMSDESMWAEMYSVVESAAEKIFYGE